MLEFVMCKLVLPDLLFPAVELFKKKNISYGTMASGSMATKAGRAQKPSVSFAINKSMSRDAVIVAAQKTNAQYVLE